MGRFDTLNADTKDLVNCLLPALATAFKVPDAVDIIPEDIRMRAWDCERRDHIKDQTENDPRNWGVQFLKDLMAISRLKGGNLVEFQDDLRAKVENHEEKHPWCRLGDIKELKDEYQNPGRKNEVIQVESSSDSSTDSYFEELVEPDEPRGTKRRLKQRNHEVYEARVMQPKRKYGHGRLRRAEEGGFKRYDKSKKKRHHSVERPSTTPSRGRSEIRRASRPIVSDREDSTGSSDRRCLLPPMEPTFSPGPPGGQTYASEAALMSNEPLAFQKLQVELEVAEAELKAARLRMQYIQAREQAEEEARHGITRSQDTPRLFN